MPTVKQVDKAIIPALKLVGGGILVYALYKVGEKTGLFKSKEVKQLEKEKAGADVSPLNVDTSNPFLSFSPSYRIALAKRWQSKYKYKYGNFSLTFQLSGIPDSGILAKRLKDAASIWGDNEEQIYGVFRAILTQYQLSFVSKMFYILYKQDLLQFLNATLSNSEMKVITNIVRNYPLYYVPKG